VGTDWGEDASALLQLLAKSVIHPPAVTSSLSRGTSIVHPEMLGSPSPVSEGRIGLLIA